MSKKYLALIGQLTPRQLVSSKKTSMGLEIMGLRRQASKIAQRTQDLDSKACIEVLALFPLSEMFK